MDDEFSVTPRHLSEAALRLEVRRLALELIQQCNPQGLTMGEMLSQATEVEAWLVRDLTLG
jgi:transcription initiation factor TFIIIB Brf1 subunit/transcription initiation factor TFIIB